MSSPFLAEIRIFPFNFAPRGWAFCDGQLMPISQNTALFALLGTIYGGDGRSTFGLPNLQGNAPMHVGQGPGLSLRDQGETAGESTVTLLQTEMPTHAHTAMANANSGGDQNSPANNDWATSLALRAQAPLYSTTSNTQMNPFALAVAGGSLPHNNMMLYLTLNFCIALQGVFPARS
jgi:microcystin-dependent protein